MTVFTHGDEELAASIAPQLRKMGVGLDHRRITAFDTLSDEKTVVLDFEDGDHRMMGFLVHATSSYCKSC